MSSITMDPPHVVNTGVACMSCCTIAPGKLLRCGACDSAWYCNQECQRKHFKEHKPFCRALRLWSALQKDLPEESWPRTAQDFYVQRTNGHRILEPMLRRPLSRVELRAILGEAKCSVCMRTRAQLARISAAATAAPSSDKFSPSAAATRATSETTTPQAPSDASSSDAAVILNGRNVFASGISGNGPSNSNGAQSSENVATTAAKPDVASSLNAHPRQMSENKAPTAASTSAFLNSESDAATGSNGAPSESTSSDATRSSNHGSSGVTLSCCPHCHWGWACSKHRDAYLAGPHAAVCMSYKNMNESQLLTYRYLTATGRLPNYVPDKLRPMGPSGHFGWEPVPAGWAAYQAWRPLPAFDGAMMCLLTKRMSQALTVMQALQHHYTQGQLAGRSHIEVHVLGASAFEVPSDRIWEEILNLMPPFQKPTHNGGDGKDGDAKNDVDVGEANTAGVAGSSLESRTRTKGGAGKPIAAEMVANGYGSGGGGGAATATAVRVLHVAFVGPELQDIILEESDGRALPQGTALSVPAPPPGRQMLYSYHLCTYQEFAAGRRRNGRCPNGNGVGGSGSDTAAAAAAAAECTWRRPDIAVAFNSGISEYDQKLWTPALEVLIRHRVPVVFTSYNSEEAEADAAAWRAAGGEVTLGPERNPFHALEPVSEPSQVDSFYYQNYYWWCGRARGQ